MRNLSRDLIYALRALGRAPLLVVVTVVSLGLGIGAATSVYTVANGLLFRAPGEYHEPERLVTLYTSKDDGSPYGRLSFPDYESVLEAVPALQSAAAVGLDGLMLGEREAGKLLLVETVSGNYFDVLGVQPILGRGFRPEETVVGRSLPVVVLGHGLWQERFAGDPGVLGETLRLGGKAFTVVGVAPETLSSRLLALRPDVWIPLGVPGAGGRRTVAELRRRRDRAYIVMGRLAEGTTLEQAQYLVPRLASRLFAFGGAFGLILSVIGVYGLVSFAVSRRTREMAIRMALGARADQILSRVVRDGMRLVVMGLAGGMVTVVALAYVARLLLYGVSPVDPTALLSGAAVILVAALAACVVPALRATRIDALATLLDD